MGARTYTNRPRSKFSWGRGLVTICLLTILGISLLFNNRTLQSGADWNDSPRVVDGKIKMSVYVPRRDDLTLVSFLGTWEWEGIDAPVAVHLCDLTPEQSAPRGSGHIYLCEFDPSIWEIPSGRRINIQYELNTGVKFWRSSPVKVKVP